MLDDAGSAVPVSVRVPASAPAGTVATVAARLVREGRTIAEGSVRVTIEPRVDFDIAVPGQVTLDEVQDADIELTLTSRSNIDDVVRLESSDDRLRFSSNAITLPSGSVRRVAARFIAPERAVPGRRYLIVVTARSEQRPDLVREHNVSVRYASRAVAGGPPTLRAQLRLTSGLRLGFGAGASTLDASLGIEPSLNGLLSDFVATSLEVAGITLTPDALRLPSSGEAVLEGETWLGRASYGPSGLAGSGTWSSRQVSVRTRARSDLEGAADWRFGVRLRDPLPDIGIDGGVSVDRDQHVESLSLRYRLPIEEVQIAVAAGAEGRSTDAGYQATPLLRQSFAAGGQNWYLRQTLEAAPLDPRWGVGVTAGTRSQEPFGVQIASRFDTDESERRVGLASTATVVPGGGVTLVGQASYEATAGEDPAGRYRFGGRATLSGQIGPIDARMGVRYRRTQPAYGQVAREDAYSLDLRASFGVVDVAASAGYRDVGSTPDEEPISEWTADANVQLLPGVTTDLEADVGYEADVRAGSGEREYGLAWTQRWSRDLDSALAVRRSEAWTLAGGKTVADALEGTLSWSDAFGRDDSELGIGYRVSLDGGLFGPTTVASHSVSATYSIALGVDARTPDTIVNLFGGRYGGIVSGRVYIDENLSGAFEPGEAPLPDRSLSIGDEATVTTDAEGRYVAAVPEGRYSQVSLPGLATGLGLVDDVDLLVARNEEHHLDLRVAPVQTLRVTLFDDRDRDGEQGADEPLLSGVGVIATGPVQRTAITSPDGIAFLPRLVRGTYRLRLDPDRAPARYEVTRELTVAMEPPGPPPRRHAGSAEKPRQVVTTFTPGAVALFASADPSRAEPGEAIELRARTQGDPERVTVVVFGETIALEAENGRWIGSWVVPTDAPEGRFEATARAEKNGEVVETTIPITIRAP